MARTRTLSEMIADVRYVADVEGAVQRHPDENLKRLLNQSIQAFRLMISSVSPYYLYAATGTLTGGSGFFTMPTDLVRTYGIDVSVGGKWRELFPFQFAERNNFEDSVWQSTGVPMYFRERDADTIDILPTPDASYSYRIWYLPTGDDLNEDSDSFDGIAGWEDWPVHNAAMTVITRDKDIHGNFVLVQSELGRIEQRIKAEAGKRHVPAATRRLDTRGRRQEVARANRWRST